VTVLFLTSAQIVFHVYPGWHLVSKAQAIDPIDDIQNQINQIAHLRELSVAATTPLESAVTDLQNRIAKAKADIKAEQVQETNLAGAISKQEVTLASQYQIFATRVAERYKRTALSSPLLSLINSDGAVDLTRDLVYRQAAEDQDNKLIHQIGSDIQSLEKQKADLQASQKRLAGLTADLDKQASFFETQIAGAKAYQAQLSVGQIKPLLSIVERAYERAATACALSASMPPLSAHELGIS